jgi:hypothetical protein
LRKVPPQRPETHGIDIQWLRDIASESSRNYLVNQIIAQAIEQHVLPSHFLPVATRYERFAVNFKAVVSIATTSLSVMCPEMDL